MIKTKIGGIALGGLAGYLILSKGINAASNMVRNICVAKQWKNYYKFGGEYSCPPGYASIKYKDKEGEDCGWESPEAQRLRQKKADGNAPQSDSKAVFSDTLMRVINHTLDEVEGKIKGKEGQTKASEEKDICPRKCDGCTAQKCPFEELRVGGVITNWSRDGEPIGGTYPWDEKRECHWQVFNKEAEPDADILTPEEFKDREAKNPFYKDSLENGVEPADEDGDDLDGFEMVYEGALDIPEEEEEEDKTDEETGV